MHILRAVFQDGRYADKILEKTFHQEKKLGARDRKFIAESVYDIVRWWRFLWYVLDEEPEVTEAALWRVFGAWWIRKGETLPPWKEWEDLDVEAVKRRLKAAAEKKTVPRAVRESIPDWMDEIGSQELGADWEAALASLNRPAPVVLRTNTLKTDPAALKTQLAKEDIDAESVGPDVPHALRLRERANVFRTEVFKKGHFEVQDSSSQMVAPFARVTPGEKVVDACAGAGGKSLHMAALMKNKGKILALDVEEWKLKELRQRASRDGVDIIEVRPIDSMKVVKRLEGVADCVLLDVPCSGLGVLRRNPDSKWKLSLDKLNGLRNQQRQILTDYRLMVKRGGRLVYSTCSLLPSENQRQVQWFLETYKDEFRLVEERTILPQNQGFDGFYMALMQSIK